MLKIVAMVGVGVAVVIFLLVAFSGSLAEDVNDIIDDENNSVVDLSNNDDNDIGEMKDDIREDVTDGIDITDESAETIVEYTVQLPEVIMPTKSSRPGCEIESLCYIPEFLSVKEGSKVVWINQDAAFHSVTSGVYGEPDGRFDSGHMDPEERFEYVFDDAGQFLYHCTLHPWMTGVIEVIER